MNAKLVRGFAVTAIVILFMLAGMQAMAQANELKMDLANENVGELPKGWTATHTGSGTESVWKIVEDAESPDGGKALAQVSAENFGSFYSLCVVDDSSFKDVDLNLSYKAVAGEEDQGGGPVWRYKDANNYYIARMNPLEDNYRVYKVEGGKRSQLGGAAVKAEAGKWHTIRIEQAGNSIKCYLNGTLYLDVTDDTFKDAGKIGLWTKADAQTRFAALHAAEKK